MLQSIVTRGLAAAILVSTSLVGSTLLTANFLHHLAWGKIEPKPISPSPAIETGRVMYLKSCAHCHNDDATGDEGPNLHGLKISDAHIALVVTNGIKGEMPSFSKKYSETEIAALTAYLGSLR